jgi:hypothetical protein
LVAEGRLSEEDLRGLGEEKLKLILGVVGIMSGPGL